MKWWRGLLGLDLDGPTERKDIVPWRTGAASTENGSNFVTNQVTVAEYWDWRVRSGDGAIGLSATWACVNLLAGTIGSLPLMVYRDVDGVRQIAKDHPLYWLLHDSPNYDQTALDFWEYIAASIELWGNGYAEIRRRGDGFITSLVPIRPDTMRVKRLSSGRIEYRWVIEGVERIRTDKDILHIRGPFGDGLSGTSTLAICRSAFSGALAAEAAANTTFTNGMRPSGVLSTDPTVALTKEQRDEFNGYLQERFAGAINSGRPLLLDRGMKWQQLNITPEDAQMLDSRKFSGEEICRVFGVPPAMAGYGDKSSNWGTGKEVDVLGFQKFSLRKRLKRIEGAVEKQLLSKVERDAGVTIEFNIEGLLRGDSEGRSIFYQTMTQIGAMTINEVRALENLPPVEGGDIIRMQMQNVPIAESGQEKE